MIAKERLRETPTLVSYLDRLGYQGSARYVAWSWRPIFDAPQWVDNDGHWAIVRPHRGQWLKYILPILQVVGAYCGSKHAFGRHVLVWDRVGQRCWVSPRQLGLAFVAMAR